MLDCIANSTESCAQLPRSCWRPSSSSSGSSGTRCGTALAAAAACRRSTRRPTPPRLRWAHFAASYFEHHFVRLLDLSWNCVPDTHICQQDLPVCSPTHQDCGAELQLSPSRRRTWTAVPGCFLLPLAAGWLRALRPEMIVATYKVAARAGMLVVGIWASTSIEMHISMRVHGCIGGSSGDAAESAAACIVWHQRMRNGILCMHVMVVVVVRRRTQTARLQELQRRESPKPGVRRCVFSNYGVCKDRTSGEHTTKFPCRRALPDGLRAHMQNASQQISALNPYFQARLPCLTYCPASVQTSTKNHCANQDAS